MNFALLAVFTVALVGEGRGDVPWVHPDDGHRQPCQEKNSKSKYQQYLVGKQLCGRAPVQSFIQADQGQVSQVCGSSGQRVENGGNLCISDSEMTVYDVKSREKDGGCHIKSNESRYDEFVKKHILKERFNRNDYDQWSRYLVRMELCGRVLDQSFIQADEGLVSQVCRSSGKRVENGGNLCISKSSMTFYVVKSHKQNGNCVVDDVDKKKDKVVLGCNKATQFHPRTMNFALLAVFTVALVGEGTGDVPWVHPDGGHRQPCQEQNSKSKYQQFASKHILNETID
ncbi:unnamed protein product [Tetraodon nigroviridis]|uniref:(spotted green pufferfish) hypothetical protein n=1 Tax=Tetraodon nigroviridis TaxID=99883 RepID=Q4S0T8_TETNG|nr:unnamed protein product [Tetraodon nigroviridis]